MVGCTGKRRQPGVLCPYSKDLTAISQLVSPVTLSELPEEIRVVNTPLIIEKWHKWLQGHPDPEFTKYLFEGIREGFHIGFNYTESSCLLAKTNMQSAVENASVIDDYIQAEVSMGRVIGPVSRERFQGIQINRFGVIPKNHQPGKWRMIVDLSHPKGKSVNDGISSDLCSLHYTSVDDALRIIGGLGKGTLLAKFDLRSAYRIVPVHPTDRLLLGMQWRDGLYIDTALPFGLRSAPKIFNAVAEGLQWIIRSRGAEPMIHYLDDFLLFGPPESTRCEVMLTEALDCCQQLGVPIAENKTEGPMTSLVFLGIQIDTVKEEIRLPQEKLGRLQKEIVGWSGKKSTTKRELLSLIGQLQHACCVVKPGRSFLRRMISLSTAAKELHHQLRLNRGFRSDLQWWATFLRSWNGRSMMLAVIESPPVAVITSDASGNWGCGAFSSHGAWFQFVWPESWLQLHITVKELLPVVISIAIWGKLWSGKTVHCRCDTAAVVAIVRSGSSKDNFVMELIRNLFFVLAEFNVLLTIDHVPGVENAAADALSRDNYDSFRLQMPSAHVCPTPIPEELVQLLVHQRPDWTSKNWTALWHAFLQKV